MNQNLQHHLLTNCKQVHEHRSSSVLKCAAPSVPEAS